MTWRGTKIWGCVSMTFAVIGTVFIGLFGGIFVLLCLPWTWLVIIAIILLVKL